MSILKPGTPCVIVAGCPENIGLFVEIIKHIGPYSSGTDGYLIRTASGRNFPQLKFGPSEELKPGMKNYALTDRHKLRPLIDSELDEVVDVESEQSVIG